MISRGGSTARVRILVQRALLTAGLCGVLAACAASTNPLGSGMFAKLVPDQPPTGLQSAGFAPTAGIDSGPVVASVEALRSDLPVAPHKVGSRAAGAPEEYSEVGLASWYGASFHGRPTANGETFDRGEITAAHLSLPLPSYVRVTNLDNNRAITVRVNDRGPYTGKRLIDVSERTAEVLGFRRHGLTRVKVDYVAAAPLRANDAAMLLASYRGPSSALASGETGRAQPVAYAEQTSGTAVASAMTRLTSTPSVVDRILMAFDVASAAEN